MKPDWKDAPEWANWLCTATMTVLFAVSFVLIGVGMESLGVESNVAYASMGAILGGIYVCVCP